MQAKVEEQLKQALESSDAGSPLIDAVLRFDQSDTTPTTLPLTQQRGRLADLMSEKIDQALALASKTTGEAPAQVRKFPLLGSALVQAHGPFLKALIEQAGVLGATLNQGYKR